MENSPEKLMVVSVRAKDMKTSYKIQTILGKKFNGVGQGAVEQKTLSKIQVFGTDDWKEVTTQ